MSNLFPDPLEKLLQDALRQQGKVKANALSTKSAIPPASFQSTYAIPENWKRTRGIALLHEGKNGLTLLGNFSEYLHIKVKGPRKLLREENPIPINGQEIVKGDWWLMEKVLHRPPVSPSVRDEEVTLDVTLKDLRVHSTAAKLIVRMLNNTFFRVELAEQTQFIDPDNKTLIFFPPGLDILDGMSYVTKLQLRDKLDKII